MILNRTYVFAPRKWGRQSYQPLQNGKDKLWRLVKQYNYAVGAWHYDHDDTVGGTFKTKKEAIRWKRIHITKTLKED